MKHERIGVGAEFGNDEGDLVRHQSADEVHVARQTIQLRNDHRALEAASISNSRGELGAAIQSIRSLAGFDLDIFGDNLEILGCGEPGERLALRLEPNPDFPCRAVLTRI